MDERQIRELTGEYSTSTEPPKRTRNTLLALLILFATALLSGAIFFGFYLYYEQINASVPDQTIIIQGGDQFVTYPETRRQAAERFGGKPTDWSQDLLGGWHYKSENPIQVPYGRNVTMYTSDLTLYWQ